MIYHLEFTIVIFSIVLLSFIMFPAFYYQMSNKQLTFWEKKTLLPCLIYTFLLGYRYEYDWHQYQQTFLYFLKGQLYRENTEIGYLAINWFSKALEAIPIKRKALFTHDSFSLHQKGKGYKAAYYLKEEEETKALRRAPYIFAMQDVEAEYFHKLAPNAKILINYSHYDFHEQPVIGNHNLLYLSGASAFNLQGLSWFIEKILPKIRLEFPNARLCIGGGICKMLSDFNKPDYIEIVGYVDDPYDFFMKGDVAINPCQVGTGLKIKTFEAISYDKVTMVHPHSLIGVYKKGEVPVFASSRAEDWVTYLRKAWHEPEFISSIKARNRQYINDMDRFVEGEYKTWLF